jgi:hypothetical protein
MFAGGKSSGGGKTGALALPGSGRTDGSRGNQHSRNKDVSLMTKHGAQKRIWGQLASARAAAPAAAKLRWQEIESRKGMKGGAIQKLKKQFLEAWVGDPLWEDAYFSQSLNFREIDTKKLTGKWITQGRLEQLIGKDEAELAVVCRAEIVGMTLIV